MPRHLGLALLACTAACATPGQVRRVETQVAVIDRDHARADSARQAELTRIAERQRRDMDSIHVLMGQLTDVVQRMGRDNAANFDNVMKQIYQVTNLASNTQTSVRHLNTQIENAVSAPPPATNSAGDTSHAAVPASPVQSAAGMLDEGHQMIENQAFSSGRDALRRLIATYPTAPEVGEANYWLGYSFDIATPPQTDSARVYYTRAATFGDNPHAATALFKLGTLELRAGNNAAARKAWQTIVDKFKNSVEYDLAQQRLRDIP